MVHTGEEKGVTTGGEQARFLIANAYDNNRRFDFNSKDAMFDRGDDWGDEMRTTVTTASTQVVSAGYGILPFWSPPCHVSREGRGRQPGKKEARERGKVCLRR